MSIVKLIAVGDICLQTRNNKHPFNHVKEIFKNKDILFGNLETVLSNQGEKAEKAVLLYSPSEKASYLKDAGFDILNIANNHIMDLGVEGFHNTLEILRRERLAFVGATNKPKESYLILKKREIRMGFLSYTGGGFDLPESSIWINKLEPVNITRDIEFIKRRCDFVVVSLHWGIENVFYPSPKQVDLAHRLIDAGATIILGHHPHVIQGIERYRHGLIAYSLGNFQFECNFEKCQGRTDKRTNHSVILSLKIGKDGLRTHDIIPVKINKDFIPYWVSTKEGEEIRLFISEISRSLNTMTATQWFEEISEEYLSGNMESWIIRIKKYGIKHLLQCIRWLISPFVIRCYIGFLTRKLKGR